jgi:sugar fermentation stimulation protein A
MKFNSPLEQGTLIKRYKRFLADIELDSGEIITAHTANTGSMKGCSEPGSRVWCSISDNPKRKYPYSWEIVEVSDDVLVGINTGFPNKLVKEGIESGVISELQGYAEIRTEVRYGKEKSRIDLLLEDTIKPPCYVEVKNVTLVNSGIAYFPDAVSKRGTKHLRELIEMVKDGNRAVIFYCLQRNDASEVRPADDIDSVYGQTLRRAINEGVEALAYQAVVTTEQINLKKTLTVRCS